VETSSEILAAIEQGDATRQGQRRASKISGRILTSCRTRRHLDTGSRQHGASLQRQRALRAHPITEAGKAWQDLLGIQDWDGNPNNAWATHVTPTVNADGSMTLKASGKSVIGRIMTIPATGSSKLITAASFLRTIILVR